MTTSDYDDVRPEERRQALLTAFVLGELAPAERAEMETELARSAELRAERERLESVLGLVRTSFAESEREALSAEATAAVVAAAARGGMSAVPDGRVAGAGWLRSPLLRIAAGVALLCGTWALYRAGSGAPAPEAPLDVAVASADGDLDGRRKNATYEDAFDDAMYRAQPAGEPEEVHETLEAAGLEVADLELADLELGGTAAGSDPETGSATEHNRLALAGEVLRGIDYAEVDADGGNARALEQKIEADRESLARLGEVDVDLSAGAADAPAEAPVFLEDGIGALVIPGQETEFGALGDEIALDTDLPDASGAFIGTIVTESERTLGIAGAEVQLLDEAARYSKSSQDPVQVADGAGGGGEGKYKGAGDTVPPTLRAYETAPATDAKALDSYAQNEVAPSGGAGGRDVRARETITYSGGGGGGPASGPNRPTTARGSAGPSGPGPPGPGPSSPGRGSAPPGSASTPAPKKSELALQGFDLPEYREPSQRSYDRPADGETVQPEVTIGRSEALTGSDDFFLGKGEKSQRREIRRGVASEPSGNRGFFAGGHTHASEHHARRWVDQCLAECRRRPKERPRDMFFRFWGDNAFEVTSSDALSTFAVDVDTASFVLARRMLSEGYLPEKAAIRTEEFVNWFRPDVAPPVEETFRVATELAPSRFGPAGHTDHWMVRVALRGRELSREERQPVALTFVVDVSGSMKENNRLELVKHALRLLLGQLDGNDSVALVAFSREARLVLPMTSAGARGVVESAIHPLSPDGGTNAEAGLMMGYEVALAGFTEGAVNRVVFLSDGVANIGQTDQDRLNEAVLHHRKSGIYLNTIGVGLANHNDTFLEQLANKGDGVCNYVDGPEEAKRALVDNFVGALQPIARDVKVQVEFDPAQVLRWRLLGYENRAVADRDFRNDAVDAGEVGAGHQVVALYEIVPTSTASSADGPLAAVRVRWKQPYSGRGPTAADEEATEIEETLWLGSAAGAFAQTSVGYRRSVLAAQLAEVLRRSIHARGDSLADLAREANDLARETGDPEAGELAELVGQTLRLGASLYDRHDELARALDAYREHCYLEAQVHEIGQQGDALIDLERQNLQLQAEIRDLLEQQIQQQGGSPDPVRQR